MQGTIIDTPQGRLAGRIAADIQAFLGIPYAQAPVGQGRLRSPRPHEGWRGIREAVRPGAASLQTLAGNQTWLNEPIDAQSEDCLFLNVWTPSTEGRLPVLVWLHGGQTRNGHGAACAIDGTALAATGIVVVTINYRLGALGGLAHPALEDETTGSCANWGMQDKMAALRWVSRSIEAFGGDPSRVTLAGQSSGAANAVLMAQNRLAGECYRAVIAQSPPLFRPPMFSELDEAAEYAEALARHMGTTVTGLRQFPGSEIQRAEQGLASSPELMARFGRPRTSPVRDGRLIRHWSWDAPSIDRPLLCGWTRSEADFWFDLRDADGRSIAPLQPPTTQQALEQRLAVLIRQHYAFGQPPSSREVVEAYRDNGNGGDPRQVWRDVYTDLVFRAPILHLLHRQVDAGEPCWGYEFAFPLPGDALSTPHASDVPFVFGTHRHPHLRGKIGASAVIAPLSTAMTNAWSRFVSDARPGAVLDIEWPAFQTPHPRIMRLGPERAELIGLCRPRGLACWPAYGRDPVSPGRD